MDRKPQRAKLHSRKMADMYTAVGWFVTHEFRERDGEEPYEILLVWPGPGEAVWPYQPFDRTHSDAPVLEE